MGSLNAISFMSRASLWIKSLLPCALLLASWPVFAVALAEAPVISTDVGARTSVDEYQFTESQTHKQLPWQDSDNPRELANDIDEGESGPPDLKADNSWRNDQDTLGFLIADRFIVTPRPPGSIWILRLLPAHIFHCLRQDARERAPPILV